MSFRLTVLTGLLSAALLCGCNFGGSGGSGADYGNVNGTGSAGTGGSGAGGGTGTSPKGGVGGEGSVSGTDDSVIATVSVGGTVTVKTGTSETLTVTFTSSDGLPITGFGISGSTLAALPAGWSGPGSFACALVQTGGNCVLTLTYAPTAPDSGMLTLNYVFVDNASLARTPTGSINIPYAATASNHVVALATPAGQINAAPGGGAQTLSVNFTTDDGYAATGLSLGASLSSLPAGWSAASSTFDCAIVSSGSGCQLPLSYAPTAPASGTLTLDFSYVDASGATQSGVINVAYATSGASAVTATATPTGQVEAVENTAGTALTLTFDTDDGGTASNLTMSLAALPAGWTSAAKSFACASISTGNGCELHLTYAPTALASGVLTLPYQYQNGNGAQRGLAQIAYTATTNDSVLASAAPSGQINAVVGMGSQSVLVTFQTNDAEPATALDVTNLGTMPPGWSTSTPNFACAGLAGGAACQLALTYAPTGSAAGTLTLDYGYHNDAGFARSATLNIPYRATTNDNVVGTPSASPLAVASGTSTPVTVTFTTDDGNPATALTLSSGLGTLPVGWSGPASFSCATLSTGTGCQLTLTYAPSTPSGAQSLMLGFSYVNDAGIAKMGSVTIQYSAS